MAKQATILYSPESENVKLDVVFDSSWGFTTKTILEDGVTIEFKAGNSVRKHYFFYFLLPLLCEKNKNIVFLLTGFLIFLYRIRN